MHMLQGNMVENACHVLCAAGCPSHNLCISQAVCDLMSLQAVRRLSADMLPARWGCCCCRRQVAGGCKGTTWDMLAQRSTNSTFCSASVVHQRPRFATDAFLESRFN